MSDLPSSPWIRPLDYDPYATTDADGYEEPPPDEPAYYEDPTHSLHSYDPRAPTDDPIGDPNEEIYESAVRDGYINPRAVGARAHRYPHPATDA